jgi:hypothetical protein
MSTLEYGRRTTQEQTRRIPERYDAEDEGRELLLMVDVLFFGFSMIRAGRNETEGNLRLTKKTTSRYTMQKTGMNEKYTSGFEDLSLVCSHVEVHIVCVVACHGLLQGQ